MFEIRVTERNSGGRVDKLVLKTFPNAPKSFAYKMFRKKNIKLNDAKIEGNEILQNGDVLTFYISDETRRSFARPENAFVEKPINVVYEDCETLICNKPVGLLSQPDEKGGDALLSRAYFHIGTSEGVSLCNRLDRNTSGLVLIGKTLSATRRFNNQISNREIKKLYLAVVVGEVTKGGVITTGYAKDAEQNVAKIDAESGETAITHFSPLGTAKGFSLISVLLETGKSHQIRLHLASKHTPILGDNKYGNIDTNRRYHADRQLLHAHKLAFPNGREFSAPPPPYFADMLKNLSLEEFL
ncbi:pseudouridine synthase [Clostridia bacterium]|nr:pseudouridine synthase [Clostridia bacterium]